MIMKINWGYGITIFYIFFASTLVFVVIQSRKVNHNLVVENYYNEDITYQKHLNKKRNFEKSNNVIVKRKYQNEEIEFKFLTTESVSGQIHFYRPSNKEDDLYIPINSNILNFNTSKLKKGRWKIKIDWQDNERQYYHEKDITL